MDMDSSRTCWLWLDRGGHCEGIKCGAAVCTRALRSPAGSHTCGLQTQRDPARAVLRSDLSRRMSSSCCQHQKDVLMLKGHFTTKSKVHISLLPVVFKHLDCFGGSWPERSCVSLKYDVFSQIMIWFLLVIHRLYCEQTSLYWTTFCHHAEGNLHLLVVNTDGIHLRWTVVRRN